LKKVSIKDVANLAQVSIASVSYVLNKMPNNRISEATTKRILEAAETLNYRPNKIAKSLKTNQSKILGFIVADIANPFFGQIAKILEEEAMQVGYTIIVGSSGENNEKFEKLIDFFIDQQVDGLILAPVENSQESLKKLQKQNFPFIILDRYLENSTANSVRINNFDISKKVIDQFIKTNVKNPLLVTYDSDLLNLVDRNNGFYEGINQSKIKTLQPIKVRTNSINEDVFDGLTKRFSEELKPDAIYFTSNKLAFAGLRFLLKTTYKVPEDVQIIAFDESEAYELFPIEISYVKQPMNEIAIKSLELILDQLNNEDKTNKIINLEAELILKESTR